MRTGKLAPFGWGRLGLLSIVIVVISPSTRAAAVEVARYPRVAANVAVEVSADGNVVGYGICDPESKALRCSVRVREFRTGHFRQRTHFVINGSSSPPSFQFDATGRRLVVGTVRRGVTGVTIFDTKLRTARFIRGFTLAGSTGDRLLSASGRYLLAYRILNRKVGRIDLSNATFRLFPRIPGRQNVRPRGLSANGQLALYDGPNFADVSKFYLWSSNTGRAQFIGTSRQGPTGFSDNGSVVVFSALYRSKLSANPLQASITRRDLLTGQLTPLDNLSADFAVTGDGDKIVSVCGKGLVVYSFLQKMYARLPGTVDAGFTRFIVASGGSRVIVHNSKMRRIQAVDLDAVVPVAGLPENCLKPV